MSRDYIIEGLDCAHCGMKIERAIREMPGIESAAVNFPLARLRVKATEQRPDALQMALQQTIDRLEDGVSLVDAQTGMRSERARNGGKKGARRQSGDAYTMQSAQGDACAFDRDHGQGQASAREQPHAPIQTHERGHEQAFAQERAHDPGQARQRSKEIARLVAGAIPFAAALLFAPAYPWNLALYLLAYLAVGYNVIWAAIKGIGRAQVFNENFLMTIATVGAFCIGEYPEGVAVMLFFQIGELFQGMAVRRSRKSISQLMDIRPDTARAWVQNAWKVLPAQSIAVGQIIQVKPGERIPLDGVVEKGSSTLDTSALTGESMPRPCDVGDEALSGCINQQGVLEIRVTKAFGDSTVSKILQLVQSATENKTPTEHFITKFARYYTPVVVGLAVLLAAIPPLFFAQPFALWLERALSFLVVSCPCALVISVPLGFFGGIGGASKCGILIKGSNYLEALGQLDTVVFDKTGTLTQGRFEVCGVQPAAGFDRMEILRLAAGVEASSNHPIGRSIVTAYGQTPDALQVENFQEIAGCGLGALVDGKQVFVGNERLMRLQGIENAFMRSSATQVYVAVDAAFAGSIEIADRIKPDAPEAIASLKTLGIRKTAMLTGDDASVARTVAERLGVDAVYANLLPQHKVECLEQLQARLPKGRKLAFVGDGINDAPVLARADLGIAMGGLGADAAIEAADIVLMTDEPAQIATAIKISRRTHGIVMQNILFSIAVKAIVLVLVAMGFASMWEAVFADVGVTLIAVINAMRALRTKNMR